MAEMMESVQVYVRAGGFLLVPLVIVCLGIWAYYLRARQAMGRVLAVSREQVPEFVEDMQGGRPDTVLATKYAGYRGQVPGAVEYVIRETDAGAMPAQAFDTYDQVFMETYSRDIVVVLALTAAAPLLGLTGTVVGMIGTFDAVAVGGGEVSHNVAGGISQALITTQLGLLVAIPGVFGSVHLRRLAARIRTRLAFYRGQLLLAYEGECR